MASDPRWLEKELARTFDLAEVAAVAPGAGVGLYSEVFDDLLERAGGLDAFLSGLPSRTVIVLVRSKERFGHFVSLSRNRRGLLYQDSYGSPPDLSAARKASLGQGEPRLLQAAFASGLPLEYNENNLQRSSRGVQTCGRWAAVRSWAPGLSVEAFRELVDRLASSAGLDRDSAVVVMTALPLCAAVELSPSEAYLKPTSGPTSGPTSSLPRAYLKP